MKQLFLTFLFCLFTTFSFGQVPQMNHRFRPNVDLSKYEVVDSLPIERIMIHFEKEIDDDRLIDLGGGYYMAPVPHNDNMIIRTTTDGKKGIIVYNSYSFGRHFEFNIENTERRMVLWYEDKNVYCGYIYDKKYKVCKYFESKKEFKRFMRKPWFAN